MRGRSAGAESKSVRLTSTAGALPNSAATANSAAALSGSGQCQYLRNRMLAGCGAACSDAAAAAAARVADANRLREPAPTRASRDRGRGAKQAAKPAKRTPRAVSQTHVTAGQRRETPAAPPSRRPHSSQPKHEHLRSGAQQSLSRPIGTTSDTISHDTIQDLPQGNNQPVEKVLLQAPGSRRIPPPAARCMSATITPTSNSASTG